MSKEKSNSKLKKDGIAIGPVFRSILNHIKKTFVEAYGFPIGDKQAAEIAAKRILENKIYTGISSDSS